MDVIAFDLSLTGSAVCLPNGVTERLTPTCKRDPERMVEVSTWVLDLIEDTGPDVIGIEGFSFGSRGRALFQVAGLGWVVRCDLFQADLPYVEVSPSTIKKYATGKGNAPKDAVIHAAARRGGSIYVGRTNDEADAWWLWALLNDAIGEPVVKVPKTHRAALEKVTV